MAEEARQIMINAEDLDDMSLIEVAYEVLKSINEPMYYRDILNEVSKLKGLNEQQVLDIIAQLYTEINIDGRFICLGANVWALKRWYPVDTTMDKATGRSLARKGVGFYDDEDEEDEFIDDEELLNEDTDDDYEISDHEEAESSFEDEDVEDVDEVDEVSFEEEGEKEDSEDEEDEY